ncbi:MAG TPA: PQQ-binding-like beta-propeller repeat protein [Candidatus Sulfotelmatobacter sp.]|nr:PQQ-binding-like beta-propeller repeat protein [Candidatus Sulfotelmatobacter sp.]
MQLSKKNEKTIAISLILLMTSIIVMTSFVSETVQAQPSVEQPTVAIPTGVTPSRTAETIAHLSFRPRIVGLGQNVLFNAWIQSVVLVANYKHYKAYQVTITKPDGTKDVVTMDSYVADATTWFEKTVDQVGTWSIKFDYLGQYFPAGYYFEGINYPSIAAIGSYSAGQFGAPTFVNSTYYQPSSDGPYNLYVQSDMVASWPPAPLPTDYWTRPVSPWNREWWPILGNFPMTGIVGGGPNWPADTNKYANVFDTLSYLPYVQGPKSSHILWKRQFNVGGLIGGTMGQTTIWESSTVIYGHPSIIYSGRAYWQTTIVIDGQPTTVWQSYDLRTGEVYWNRYPVSQIPTFIIYDYGTSEISEAEPHLAKPVFGYIGGGRLLKYDPWTGAVMGNYSIAPLTTGTFYADPYVLSVQDLGTNATSGPGGRYRLINWTVSGTLANLTTSAGTRIISNISWPLSSLPVTTDFEAEIAVSASSSRILSYNIRTGELIANISTGIEFATEGTPALADHGKFAQRYNDGHWHAWDVRTGAHIWESELSSWPWGTFGTYGSASYGGMIFSNNFDSITTLNWTTGKIVWTYVDPAGSPFESPYTYNNLTVNPWHTSQMIADGVYYTTNAEHSADMPIKRGWRMHAINATTGEKIWSLVMGQSGSTDGSRVFQGAIADGYLAYSDAYTTTMYVVGKGKSATTVTASPKTSAKGNAVLIEGTVLDQSPAQSGTPAVSKQSMTLQMEHLHIAQPLDGIYHNETITGVPVTLNAMGSDGSIINIGTVTTNGYYGTFSKAWTPPAEGTYTIIASFAADDSYGSSDAATAITVGPASEPTTVPEQQTVKLPPIELYFTVATIAIIIAIAIVGALLLRKRQ